MTDPIAGRIPPPTDEVGGVCARRATARAKVNLTLEVLGRRADGDHALRSLVAFTDFGDDLWLHPGRRLSLSIEGPFAAALQHDPQESAAFLRGGSSWGEQEQSRPDLFDVGKLAEGGNLIQRAAVLYALATWEGRRSDDAVNLAAASASAQPEGAFRLTKRIPVAAGLGGGSADAAAALRLLAGLPPEASGLSALLPLAAKLGADVPACLFSKPAIMTGIGEQLHFLAGFPVAPVILVNPGVPLATAAVFRELRAGPLQATPEAGAPSEFADLDDLIAYARPRPNDLEAPARRLLPVIGAILDSLAACPGALLPRLSGSGPTCFALFRTRPEAEAAASGLRSEHPDWWIEATHLGS